MTTFENAVEDKWIFGFWVYLMSDLIMFAALFAAYAVLRGATFGGPSGRELLGLPNALAETLILLVSSTTSSIALVAARRGRADRTLLWFGSTFVLGLAFLGLELAEFGRLMADGNGPQRSAFLSSFFALVGTHGLHISIGLLWMAAAMVKVRLRGLTPHTAAGLERLGLFWHFLDIVWIFIFTVVYLTAHVA